MTRKRRIPKYQTRPEWSPGAIAADLSQQAPNNSYAPAVTFYVDRPFDCVDCGVHQVWTAEQQKWYYEVAKGPIAAVAVRRRACRRKRRETLGKTGDPRANQGPHSLMKRIERSLATAAVQAGFGTPMKTRLGTPGSLALDYRNAQSILTCSFDKHTAMLSAEMLTNDQVISIVRVPLDGPGNQAQLLEKMQEFIAGVEAYLRGIANE